MSEELKKRLKPVWTFLIYWVMLGLVQYLVIFLPEGTGFSINAIWKTMVSSAISAMVVFILLALEREKRTKM